MDSMSRRLEGDVVQRCDHSLITSHMYLNAITQWWEQDSKCQDQDQDSDAQDQDQNSEPTDQDLSK